MIWLSAHTAAEMRQAKDDPAEQKRVLCAYYKRGARANLTQSKLIDFLAVSSGSILDMAGYDDAEGDAVMVISDTLTEADILEAALSRGDGGCG